MFSGAQPLFTNPCHLCVTHIYVEKPGLEPGMVHVLILRSIALALPLFQRLPIAPLLHICRLHLHRFFAAVMLKLIP